MLEPPDLPQEKIAACLREGYGMRATRVTFLPAGNEPGTWAYRVDLDDGSACFLKVKRGAVDPPGLRALAHLKACGIGPVVAPVLTRAGEPWLDTDEFSLTLFPFVDGTPAMGVGLSDDQWVAYGAFLNALHTTSLPDTLRRQLKKENFKPRWSRMVRALRERIHLRDHRDQFEKALAGYWKEHEAAIEHVVSRAETLGRILQSRSPAVVLCHADIHTANLLVDRQGRLSVVDWDGLMLAPRERDLMFVTGRPEEALFFTGYGQTDIDRVTLAYYRYEWVVQEIGDYGERVFLSKEGSDPTRAHALQGFRALFQPGDVVEEAHRSEAQLPPEYKSIN